MNIVNSDVENESNYTNSLNTNKWINTTLLKPAKTDKELMAKLSRFQKILLITNGTVTELLEHYLEESIIVEKLYEDIMTYFNRIPGHQSLIIEIDSPVLVRKVILKGKSSLNNYLYAESSILLNQLPHDFRHDLIYSHMPIGKLWSKYRFETYKADFVVQREKAGTDLANYLNISSDSDVLSRTYCVYSRGERTMIITEKFSVECFVD